MRPDSASPVLPFLVACAGIATFSAMDVLMKGLSIELGAYNAVLWRTGTGTLVAGLIYFASRPKWPDKATADACFATMETDPAWQDMDMPFDGKRMMWGGFEAIFER